MNSVCFVTLKSVHYVMKAQKILLAENITINVIATPREISHNCGVVIRFECCDIARVCSLMRKDFDNAKFFEKGSAGVREIQDDGGDEV